MPYPSLHHKVNCNKYGSKQGKPCLTKNEHVLGWLAAPVGMQPARARFFEFAVGSLTGVYPQINFIASHARSHSGVMDGSGDLLA